MSAAPRFREPDCVLCDEVSHADTPIVFADEHVVIFAARWPVEGHEGAVLVVTRRHIPTLYDIDDELAAVLMLRLRDAARAVQNAFDATGSTIRQNNGPPGQDVEHLHFHVAPRYLGDDYWNARPREARPAERAEWANRIGEDLAGGSR